MAEAGSGPRWRFLISPQWLAWHAFAVVAFWGMCWLGDWQFHRAMSGNSLSWAYTFEWPLFAVMGGYFWAKTIRDEFHLRSGAVSGTADGRPGGALLWEAAAGKDLAREDLAGEDLAVEAAGEGGRPAMAGQGPGDRAADDRAAHLARLSQEVRGHGRWHGLR
jgi:hypothetical protein